MQIVQYLIHIEKFLPPLIAHYGTLIYALLFFVVFAETGFVVTPFLPGDSLLFVVGTLAGGGYFSIWTVYFLLLAAAILGNMLNYWLGYKIGHKVFAKENSRFFNKKYLEKTRAFYAKHGGKTIILTRFIPIIRSFAPFVAGMGSMEYKTFMVYNLVGGFLWVTILTFAGYFFGGVPIIKKNFELAVFAIVIISVLPGLFEFIKHKLTHEKEPEIKKTNLKEIEKTFAKKHLKE